MKANSLVALDALLLRFETLPSLRRAIEALETLRLSLASVGTPQHTRGRWHSVNRILGSVPWRDNIDVSHVEFRKIELHADDFRDRPEYVLRQLTPILDAGEFLELEMRGHNGIHYMECMGSTLELRQLRDRLFRYDLQSVVFVDLVTDDERQTHADALLVVRQCLQLGSCALDKAPGAASLVLPRAGKDESAEDQLSYTHEPVQSTRSASPGAPPPVWIAGGAGLILTGATARSEAWHFSIRIPADGSPRELYCLVQIASDRLPAVLPVMSWVSPAGLVVAAPIAVVADVGWVLLRSEAPAEGGELLLSHQYVDAASDVDAVVMAIISTLDPAAPTSLVEANRLWRERRPAALSAYLALLAQNPRPTYARNAVLCARTVSTLAHCGQHDLSQGQMG